jgi:uncharacterized lipoprotein YmbA
MKQMLWIFGLCALTACSSSPDRYAVTSPPIAETQRIGFRAIEVRDVSLPAYAAADDIAVLDDAGRLVGLDGALWADTPSRAIALEISQNLARMSGARVAPEPWPFEAFPDARLDIRFQSLIAGPDGRMRATGQYFVGVSDGRRERSGLFDLSVAYDPAGGAAAVSAARGQIVLDLTRLIARDGLR